jgi:hypothetical protein
VIDPEDFVDNTTCDTFTNGSVTLTYPNSVLALVKSDLEYWADDLSKAQPLRFTLNFWENDTDVRRYRDAVEYCKALNLSRTLPFSSPFTSIHPPTHTNPHICSGDSISRAYGLEAILFHLNSTYSASTASYSFTGYRNSTQSSQLLQFAHPQCTSSSPVVFDGGLIEPGTDWSPRLVPTPKDYPRVTARFDSRAAEFEITATLGTYTAGRGTGASVSGQGSVPKSFLGGDVRIRFQGTLDAARSDELLANPGNGTPLWRPTLGFEKALDGSVIKTSGGAGVSAGWTAGVGLLAVLIVFGGL